MRQPLPDRRFLLKAGLGGVLSLINHPSLADILDGPGNAPATSPPGDDTLLAAQARLGANLIRQLADQGKTGPNIVVSPASLASILSFVELGAGEHMRDAIHRAVGFKSTGKRRIDADFKAIRGGLAAAIAGAGEGGPLALANLLVFDPSTKPRQLALLGVSGAGADVLVDNLANPKTIDRINQWVKRRTRDLIPSIIEETPNSLGLVAINALYFKDRWRAPFDPRRTVSEKFQSLAADMDVSMMHSSARKLAIRGDDRFVAAELAYAHEGFKLVIVTTKSKPARVHEFAPVFDWLDGKGFEVKTGEIALPKLTLSGSEELLRPLDALGLRIARHEPNSLSGFSLENLIISRIVQRTELRLDEQGTEAAAATAVTTTRSLAPDNYVKLTVDKPFVFALRDQKSSLILLMGYVGAPKTPTGA